MNYGGFAFIIISFSLSKIKKIVTVEIFLRIRWIESILGIIEAFSSSMNSTLLH